MTIVIISIILLILLLPTQKIHQPNFIPTAKNLHHSQKMVVVPKNVVKSPGHLPAQPLGYLTKYNISTDHIKSDPDLIKNMQYRRLQIDKETIEEKEYQKQRITIMRSKLDDLIKIRSFT